MKVIVRHDTERLYSHADECPGRPDCVHGECDRCSVGPVEYRVKFYSYADSPTFFVCAECAPEARRLGAEVEALQ